MGKSITYPLDNGGYTRYSRIIQFDQKKVIYDGKDATLSRWRANRLLLLDCLRAKGLLDPPDPIYHEDKLRDSAYGYSTVLMVTTAEGTITLPRQAFTGLGDLFDGLLIEQLRIILKSWALKLFTLKSAQARVLTEKSSG